MKHYLITNRKVSKDNNGKEYLEEEGKDSAGEILRFGIFDSTDFLKNENCRSSLEIFQDSQAISKTTVAPFDVPNPYHTKDVALDSNQLTGSSRLFTELYKSMSGTNGGDLLFYIHGFHTDLKGALQTVCDLEKQFIKKESPIKHIVFFTWPAMSQYLRYRDDAKDAELSGYTLARCYLMLIDFFRAYFLKSADNSPQTPCGNNIHLLVHSMGNRVVENMMIELYRKKGDNITALFKEVILAAADVDWQVFEEPRALYNLINICQRSTIYYNTHDLALLVSETTKNSYNRLGKYGFRDINKVPSHVYSVDCSGVKNQTGIVDNIVDHSYYVASNKVVDDIIEVLKGRKIEDFLQTSRTSIPGNAKQYRLIL